MTKRSTSIQEDSLSPSLKRTRSNTSQEEHDFTPDTKQKPRGRKSLPGALSLSTSATSVDTPSNAAIRRRMNPDSLAGRLGPDLVKELESLLKPGMTEMPSFTVRQEIQQRYNIDRRHVYDWFHNKGLRVTTSEKREERRAMRAREHAHMPTTRNQAQGKNRARAAADTLPSSASMPILRHASPDSKVSTPTLSASSFSGFTGNQLPYKVICTTQQNLGYSFAQPGGCTEMLFDSATMEPVMDPFSGVSSQHPATPDRIYRTDAAESTSKAYGNRTSHWIAEQQKIPYSPVLDAPSPLPGSEKGDREFPDAILPLHGEKVLPQHQREACYRSLSEVLPPARGIEECVGTYKAFMSQQGLKHYERFVYGYSSASRHQTIAYTPVASSLVSPSVPSLAILGSPSLAGQATAPSTQALGANTDYSNWLPYGIRSHRPSIAPSPSETPSLSKSLITANSSALWSHDGNNEHQRKRSDASCVDIAEILESPVLRSRHPTQASFAPASPRYALGSVDPALSSSYGIDAIRTSFPYAPPTGCYDYNRGHQYAGSFPAPTAPCIISAPLSINPSQNMMANFHIENQHPADVTRGGSKGREEAIALVNQND